MRLIFFATQDWAAEILDSLIKETVFDVVAVITQPNRPTGRKQILTASPVKRIALLHHLPVYQPTKLREPEFLRTLKEYNADIAVVMAYGRLLPQELLTLFPNGVLNVHPSLLPKWRGPSPVQATIAAGETVSGVTVMKIDEQMDHGPILSQQSINISTDETTTSFMKKVVDVAGPLLKETLKKYVAGFIHPQPQIETNATYCKLLTRQDGKMNWNDTAAQIDQLVRAHTPWPASWTEGLFHNHTLRLKLLKVHIGFPTQNHPIGTIFSQDNRLYIATGQGTIEIDEIQPEGKSVLTAKVFLSGYGQILGQVLVSSAEETKTQIK